MASRTVGAISSSPSSTTLLISVNGVPWINFSKSTVAHTKMGHVSKSNAHFWGDLSFLWQDLIYSNFVQNLTALAITDICMGPPKFKTGHVT